MFWHYLRYESPIGDEEPVVYVEPGDAPALPNDAGRALRGYVRSFPRHLVAGRGLVIRSDAAPLLTTAAEFVAEALRKNGIVVAQRRAHLPVLPSEAETLRRARLVVVERAEYASAAMRDILAARLDLGQPVVVTTATDLAGRLEDDLVRVLNGHCTEIRIFPPASDG